MRPHAGWVPETRFGTWFLGTRVWLRYVLTAALDDFAALLGAPRRFRTILDVGCGQGQAFPLLQQRFHPDVLVAVDLDAHQVARAQTVARSCPGRVEVRVADASALDVEDAAVDMVFCHQTVHHLLEPERALREFHRVLRPGGVLLLAESCRPFIHSLLVRVLFRHPMHIQKSAEEYLALLRTAGFAFGPDAVTFPYPPWARPDLGLREWLGRPSTPRGAPLVHVAAVRA